MDIQRVNVSAPSHSRQNPAFGNSIITLSVKNLGNEISKNVVDTFNKGVWQDIQKNIAQEGKDLFAKIAPASDAVIRTQQDLVDKVDYFALAAGSGSRFKALAAAVGEKTGNSYNKISVPINIDENQNLHMLDFAMAMGKYFTQKEGYATKIAPAATGSFGDIVQHYLAGNPIKDVVVSCGDNIFGTTADDMMTFFTKTINNAKKHLALVGVERTPEEVAERFGVLGVKPIEGAKDVMKLASFAEKPVIEEAKQLATADGMNIANTGMFYISKDAMTKLMGEIKDEMAATGKSTLIAKNDKEVWDFANAVKYVHSKMGDWFGIKSAEGSDVKIVKKWEDVGEPPALYRFLDEVKNGTFLDNFPKATADKIRNVLSQKTSDSAIIYTDKYKTLADVPKAVMDAATEIEGRKVIG